MLIQICFNTEIIKCTYQNTNRYKNRFEAIKGNNKL